MKNVIFSSIILMALIMTQCKTDKCKKEGMSSVTKEMVDKTIKSITDKYPSADKQQIEKGITQVAGLWTSSDGSGDDFSNFCLANYAADSSSRDVLFNRLSANFEVLFGNMNRISLALKRQLHLDIGEIVPVDEMFGSYDPFAHFNDDFFLNKIAFISILNFPCYTLKEKE